MRDKMWLVLCFLLSVASNGVIGAVDETPEECSVCRKGNCRSISGLYTKPEMPPGYSLIAQIPQGACRILVQQLKPTRNYIALRNANGSFIINGEWKFSPTKVVEGAGTLFRYIKQDSSALETITASGPLSNPVDIMIVYQQPNPGIKYGYAIPESKEQIAPPFLKRPAMEPRRLDLPAVTQRDEARPIHRRRIRRRFVWKISGVSPCSKSCGGGIQTTMYSCVREHTQMAVSDKRCLHMERPLPQQIRCNNQACPPSWAGLWGPCSASCGQGVQQFVGYQCQQEAPSGNVIVSDAVCLKSKPAKPPLTNRPCRLAVCENESDNEIHPDLRVAASVQEWKVGPWSQCSVSCGTGQRTRMVSCSGGRCSAENRPPHAEYCDSGSCTPQGQQISPWLVSEWSQCSELCGTGTQDRYSVCGRNQCDSSSQPETTRACSSDRYCIGQWFVGPWGVCPEGCNGVSKQTREVFCVVKVRGQSRMTNEMTCSTQDKPETERACHGGCSPKWFVGEWGGCDGCPAGTQRREVRCMEADGDPSNDCMDEERPAGKRPCACERRDGERRDDHVNKVAHDEPQDRNCVDSFSNCHLAVQARLCQYAYYASNCCVSCGKQQQ